MRGQGDEAQHMCNTFQASLGNDLMKGIFGHAVHSKNLLFTSNVVPCPTQLTDAFLFLSRSFSREELNSLLWRPRGHLTYHAVYDSTIPGTYKPFNTLNFEHVVFSRMFARFCFDYRWYLIEKQPDDLVSRVFEIFLSNRTTKGLYPDVNLGGPWWTLV